MAQYPAIGGAANIRSVKKVMAYLTSTAMGLLSINMLLTAGSHLRRRNNLFGYDIEKTILYFGVKHGKE